MDPTLAFLDPGERAAIALAVTLGADVLLIDEYDGRQEAERRRLRVTGTLDPLGAAHIAGLLDFEVTLLRLRRTNFYLSETIVNGIRDRLSRAPGSPTTSI